MLRREIGSAWGRRSIHEISKRDVIDAVSAIEQRGAPVAANKALKSIKTFLRWCVGRAVLDRSPADGVPLPAKEVTRDRVLNDDELARVIAAARQIGGPYGGIVELLALTGQRREEVARCTWDEIDLGMRSWKLSSARTKNAKAHEVYLSDQAVAVLGRVDKIGALVFSHSGNVPFQDFSVAKRELDQLSGVAGGGFMTCAGPACRAWQGLVLRLMSPTRFSITKAARFLALRRSINATIFLQNEKRRWKCGARTSSGPLERPLARITTYPKWHRPWTVSESCVSPMSAFEGEADITIPKCHFRF